MRTKTPQQSEKILEAAGRLFGTQRFHEVRMEDIAAGAKVGKGTLYRYFQDKEELYLALLTQASRQFTQQLKEAAAQADSPRIQLEAVVAAIITFFDDHPHLMDLIQRAELMRPTGTPFPWQEARQELLHLVHDLFVRGKKQAELAIGDPELAVLMLLGGVRSIIRMGKRPRPRNLARQIIEHHLVDGKPKRKR